MYVLQQNLLEIIILKKSLNVKISIVLQNKAPIDANC